MMPVPKTIQDMLNAEAKGEILTPGELEVLQEFFLNTAHYPLNDTEDDNF